MKKTKSFMHFDVKEIVSAWVSKINPTKDQKQLATSRAEICNTCSQVGKLTSDEKVTRYCKQCGCLIEGKIYSYKEGACPLGKWNKVDAEYRNTKAIKVLKDPNAKLI